MSLPTGLILPPRSPALGRTAGDFVSAEGSGIFPSAAVSTATIGAANNLYLTPRRVLGTETYDQIIVEATTGGALGKCRVGCFADNNGRPGALILDSGEIDISGTAVVATPISLTLVNRWVWDFIVFNNTAAVMRGLTANFSSVVPRLTNNTVNLYGSLHAAHTYGAAPATCPTATQGDSRWFRIQYRIA